MLQLYLNAAHACDARVEFQEGGTAQGARTASAVVVRCGPACCPARLGRPVQHTWLLTSAWPASLPESGAVFVRAFVDAFVQQKTSDGYEVVDSLVAAQDEGEAAPVHHSPKPSSPTEGEAAGTGAARERYCTCLNTLCSCWNGAGLTAAGACAEGSLDYEQGSQGQSQVLLQPLCKPA